MKMLRIVLVLMLISLLSSCKVYRFFVYNFADINDHKIFPKRELPASETPFHFYQSKKEIKPKSVTINEKTYSFEDYLKQNETVAFLIIRNDSILYEEYFDGYEQHSIVPSFSMAKSVTSMLIGKAIEDGLIQSVQNPVINYIPELKNKGFEDLKIEHLLQMTSGIKFNEGYYNPFGEVASYYYGTDLRKSVAKLKPEYKPGERFKYVSGDTQLLGVILNNVLKDQSVTEYLYENFWKHMGMQNEASWSLDSEQNGMEKTFCCLNATAIDFAKIGRLYLHKGNWNGQQLISKEWVAASTKIDESNGSKWYYQYQWWLPSKNGDFAAQGILGQYVYVNPAANMIIVRLGKDEGEADWENIFISLSESMKLKP